MKKIRIITCVACIVAISLLIPWITNRPTNMFPSRGLEAVIREQINKPNGDITPEDCMIIAKLDLSLSDWNTNLEGIQYFVNLEILNCSAGRIADISALSNLTQLRELKLYKNNVRDLSPLTGLINLEILDIYDNNVNDLSPLASLTNLKRLIVGKNPVELLPNGFAPLGNLQGLQIGSYADYEIVVGEDDLIFPYLN